MSLSAAARRLRMPAGGAYLVPAAATVAGLLAIAVAILPLKAVLVLVGGAGVLVLAFISRRPRAVLLGLSIGLLSLDLKSYPSALWLHLNHIGGSPGLVLTAQLVLLIPLAALAVVDRAGQAGQAAGRLPAGSLLIPLIPIVAALPSLAATRDLSLSVVELVRMVCFYLLYLYFAADFKPTDIVLLVGALLFTVLIQLPFAAVELAVPSFHFSFIGGSEQAMALERIAGAGVKRVTGTMIHPNFLGGYLSILLPFAFAFAIAEKEIRWLRYLAVAALLAGLPMLLLTFNRGSWVGVAIAAPLIVILAGLRGHLTSSQAVGYLIGIAVVGAILLALPPVWDRFFASDPNNVDFRLDINNSAVMMWQAFPWSGAGLNTFAESVQDFDYRNAAVYRWPVHNIFLLWLSETGIIGAAGMVVFLLWSAVTVVRVTATEHRRAALVAIGVAGGMLAVYVGDLASFGVRYEPIAQALFILIGAIVALGRRLDVPQPATLGRLGELKVT